MEKGNSAYYKAFFESISWDVNKIIDEFSSGPSYRYQDFCKIWKKNMLLLTLINLKKNRLAEVGNLILYFFCYYLRRGEDVRHKLCAIYALFSFVTTDCFLEFYEIRLVYSDVLKVNELYSFLKEKKFFEAIYMLIFLKSKGYFKVTYNPFPMHLGTVLGDYLEFNEGDRRIENGFKRVYNILINSFKRDEQLLSLETEYNLCKYKALTALNLEFDPVFVNETVRGTRSLTKKANENVKIPISFVSSDDDFDTLQNKISDFDDKLGGYDEEFLSKFQIDDLLHHADSSAQDGEPSFNGELGIQPKTNIDSETIEINDFFDMINNVNIVTNVPKDKIHEVDHTNDFAVVLDNCFTSRPTLNKNESLNTDNIISEGKNKFISAKSGATGFTSDDVSFLKDFFHNRTVEVNLDFLEELECWKLYT